MIEWKPTAEALNARIDTSPAARGNPALAEQLRRLVSDLGSYGGQAIDAVASMTRAQWEAMRDARGARANGETIAALVAAEAAIRTLEGTRQPADSRPLPDRLLPEYSVSGDWTTGEPGESIGSGRWLPRLPALPLAVSLDEFPVTRARVVLAAASNGALTLEAPELGVWGNTLEACVPTPGALELRRGGVVEAFTLTPGFAPAWVPPVGWPPPGTMYATPPPALLGAATWVGSSLPAVCDWLPFVGGHGRVFGELLSRGARAGAAAPSSNIQGAGAGATRALAASVFQLPFVLVDGAPLPALDAASKVALGELNTRGVVELRTVANRLVGYLANANDMLAALPAG